MKFILIVLSLLLIFAILVIFPLFVSLKAQKLNDSLNKIKKIID